MTSSIISSLVAYTLFSIPLAATPGPDMILVLRSALREGLGVAFGVIIGILTSLFIWGIATILGLSALVLYFKQAFIVFKWAGVAYLVYLGGRSLLAKSKAFMVEEKASEMISEVKNPSFLKGYRQGLVTNLVNPMIGFLFLLVFPAYIPKGEDIQLFTLILTLLQMLVAFSIFTSLALFAQPASKWLKEARSAVWVDRLAGISLLYFAAKLFFADPPI